MKPYVVLALAATLALSVRAEAHLQVGPAAAATTFEVATVKRNISGGPARNLSVQPGGRYTLTNTTLNELVRMAFTTRAFDNIEVSGGPKWVDSDRFDIVAKAPDGVALVDPDGLPRPLFTMLRALVEDRFQLTTHYESAERAGYALVVSHRGRLGPKLRTSSIDCVEVTRQQAAGTFKRTGDGPPPCSVGGPPGRLVASAITMDAFARIVPSPASSGAGSTSRSSTGPVCRGTTTSTWSSAPRSRPAALAISR
jgi:uncharacterized protein (TIGR03435 family)